MLDIEKEVKEWREFCATPLGKAFTNFENLLGRAWIADSELGLLDYRSDVSAKKAWQRADEARKEFISELKKLLPAHGEKSS